MSAVVGRRVKLKKAGSEWKGLSPFNKEDTPSFTVNDDKRFFHDFSSNKHGDIFEWFIETEGCDFPQAVARCAEIAGIPLPSKANGHREPRRLDDRPEDGPPRDPPGDPGPGEGRDARDDRQRSAREITRTYDYTDGQGSLIYQVCRVQWEENGKRKKTFIQRRPAPERDGRWIWGLSAGEFVQGRDGDWFQATEARAHWRGPRRQIAEGVEHGLYRLVEFIELRSTEEPVFLLEGEKDVDTARSWDLVATTNSGGARHWRPEFAEYFRGLDVVIPMDNDQAGRDRGDLIARSLRGVARNIRILDWAAIWPEAPKGADLTDWRQFEEGTRDELMEIVGRLPEWQPPPFVSQYGLMMWGEHNAPGDDYEYLIEDLIPEREPVLIQGESQSGKSFLTQGMGLAGAEGREFFGRRVLKPFGVIYLAYEAGKGFRYRMRAHERYFGLDAKKRVPFGVLTKPIDLWSAEINTDKLIDEILGIVESRFGDVPLGAVVIDTHNRATPGASEIDSKDISRIIDRYSRIMERTRAGVWIIGHKNAAGKHRGNEQLYNNIETAIDISRKTEEVEKQRVALTDVGRRPVRVATVIKQREGIDGQAFEFVLASVEVGTNRYGKPRTSCVAVPPATGDDAAESATGKARGVLALSPEQESILKALQAALEEFGETPPASLKLPQSIKRVVKAPFWKAEYLKIAPDGAEAKDNTINARMKRASEKLQSLRVIGRLNPWVWITGRPVRGVIEPRAATNDYENPYPGRAEPAWPADIEDFIK